LSRSERRHPAAAVQPAFDDNLADEHHNSVYRDYHYQRLNMGSAPGLRSIQPGYAFPYETQAKRRTGAPDVPRSVAFF
jgi:hypothetical protein